MSHYPTLFHYGVLLVMGTCWGFTVPLYKIAVSSGHGQFGLISWQLLIGVFLVQPRRQGALAPGAPIGDTGRAPCGPIS